MDSSGNRYKPQPGFEEEKKDPLVDINLTDSTELWLIQWPYNQLKPSDFHGKELSLKLHRDGQLGTFESSSGKSYDIVSFAAQERDAIVFLPSQSESKVVGKISRRVSLVRYPDPGEYEKRNSLNLSSQGPEGSWRKGMSRRSGTDGISRGTLTSTHSMGQKSMESPKHSKHKRHEQRKLPSDVSMRSAERASHASGPESQITNTSLGSEKSHGERSNKKKRIKVEE